MAETRNFQKTYRSPGKAAWRTNEWQQDWNKLMFKIRETHSRAVVFPRPCGRCPYLNFPANGLTGPVDSRITSSGSTMITSRGSTVS